MSPRRRPEGQARYGSPAHRERISRGVRRANELRRRIASIMPADLRHFEASGAVAPSLRVHVEGAAAEAMQLERALTADGRVPLSPQRRALLADFVRLGVLLRGVVGAYLRTEDSELASRAATIAAQRARHLALLGLDERKVELSLADYLAQRAREREAAQAPRGEPNGPEPEVQVVEGENRAPLGDDGAAVEPAPAVPGRAQHQVAQHQLDQHDRLGGAEQ